MFAGRGEMRLRARQYRCRRRRGRCKSRCSPALMGIAKFFSTTCFPPSFLARYRHHIIAGLLSITLAYSPHHFAIFLREAEVATRGRLGFRAVSPDCRAETGRG